MFKCKLQKSLCFLNSGRAASCFKNAVSYKLFLIKVKCICNECFFSQWSQFPIGPRRTMVREQTKEVKIRGRTCVLYVYIRTYIYHQIKSVLRSNDTACFVKIGRYIKHIAAL